MTRVYPVDNFMLCTNKQKNEENMEELAGVSFVDNRPSTDKLHHFVQKKKKEKNCDL